MRAERLRALVAEFVFTSIGGPPWDVPIGVALFGDIDCTGSNNEQDSG